jgi:hypothetical protein
MKESSADPAASATPPNRDLARKQLTVVNRQKPGILVLPLLAAVLVVAIVETLLIRRSPAQVPTESFNFLVQRSWAVLGFAAAVGLASAATIQLAKQLFGLRSWFQSRWVRFWIRERCDIEPLWGPWLKLHETLRTADLATAGSDRERVERDTKDPGKISSEDFANEQAGFAVDQLEAALLGGYSKRELRRIFDLPIEQLCALMSSAADQALSQPQDYAELLLAFSGPAGLPDIDALAPPRQVVGSHIIRNRGADDKALGRLAQSTRSGLDVLQVSVGQQWSRTIRTLAVVLSGILGVVFVFFTSLPI